MPFLLPLAFISPEGNKVGYADILLTQQNKTLHVRRGEGITNSVLSVTEEAILQNRVVSSEQAAQFLSMEKGPKEHT